MRTRLLRDFLNAGKRACIITEKWRARDCRNTTLPFRRVRAGCRRRGVAQVRHAGPSRAAALQALLLLTSRPGELVTREEIREAIWGKETCVDFDQGLNVCIRQIRPAISDAAATPRYVETLPRRG